MHFRPCWEPTEVFTKPTASPATAKSFLCFSKFGPGLAKQQLPHGRKIKVFEMEGGQGVLWVIDAGFSLFLMVSNCSCCPLAFHFLPTSLPRALRLSNTYRRNSQIRAVFTCSYNFLKSNHYNKSLILQYSQWFCFSDRTLADRRDDFATYDLERKKIFWFLELLNHLPR